MLQVDEVPAWLKGTKNCFTAAALYQTIHNADENFTIYSSVLELDSTTRQVVIGRDVFAFMALSDRLDAALYFDALRKPLKR